MVLAFVLMLWKRCLITIHHIFLLKSAFKIDGFLALLKLMLFLQALYIWYLDLNLTPVSCLIKQELNHMLYYSIWISLKYLKMGTGDGSTPSFCNSTSSERDLSEMGVLYFIFYPHSMCLLCLHHVQLAQHPMIADCFHLSDAAFYGLQLQS